MRLPSSGSGACVSERSKPAHPATAAGRTTRPKPGQINKRCTLRNEKKPVPERACCCSVKTQRRARSWMNADKPNDKHTICCQQGGYQGHHGMLISPALIPCTSDSRRKKPGAVISASRHYTHSSIFALAFITTMQDKCVPSCQKRQCTRLWRVLCSPFIA